MNESERKLSNFDSKVLNYSKWVIKWRWLIILTTFIIAGLAASGGRFLVFDTNYRVFFGDDNPQLADFEQLQNIYILRMIILLSSLNRQTEKFLRGRLSMR